ncbi:MAG TPA: hypothetical protein DER64_22785, partial [Planctomycetaceae bacterium]|nr:hypothetical protein [Planctomycetaceae bacterium]
MRIQQQSTSMNSIETLRLWTKVGLRWSGHTAWSTILTLSLLTTAGCGGSDSGEEQVAQSDTKASGGGGGGGGMPGGGGGGMPGGGGG